MIDPNQERLKSLLLQLAGEQTGLGSKNSDWGQTFERLVATRFEAAEVLLTEEIEAKVLGRMRAALQELKPSETKTHPNGTVPNAIRALFHVLAHPRRLPDRRIAWIGLAVGAVILATAWFALDLPGAPGVKSWIAGQSRQEKQSPTLPPESRQPRAPTPAVPEEPRDQNEGTPSPKNDAPRGTSPRPIPEKSDEGLLARKIKVGVFASVMGEPTTSTLGEGKFVRAKPKMAVYAGTRIETGDADKAEIRLNNGTVMRLTFNTKIEIPSTASKEPASDESATTSRIRLLIGRAWTIAQKSRDGETLVIETPVATAEVVGTEFGLEVRKISGQRLSPRAGPSPATLEAILQVREGRVGFYNALGKVETTSMTESRATITTAPTPPKRLSSLKTFAISGEFAEVLTAEMPGFPGAAERLDYPWGWVGLTVRNVAVPDPVASKNPKTEARITRVERGSPAARAGLRVGDVVTAIDAYKINLAQDVDWIVCEHAGELLAFHCVRGQSNFEARLRPVRPHWAPSPPLPPSPLRERLDESSELLIQGWAKKGEQALAAILAQNPNLAPAHNNLGLHCETQDELGKAIIHYQHAVASAPKVALYRFNLGMSLRSIGNFARAAEELESAARLAPAWPFAQAELADILMILDRFDEAGRVLRALKDRNPESADAWLSLADYYRRTKEPKLEFEATKKAMELEPDYPEALRAHAVTIKDNPAEAERLLRRATELDPTDHHAFEDLGNLLDGQDRFEEAEKALLKSLELAPGHATAYSNLGYMYRAWGKFDKAEKAYLEAIRLDPDHAPAYSNLGFLYINNLNKPDEAERVLLKAIEIEPDLTIAYHNLAFLYQTKLDRKADAVKMYLMALDLDPSFSRAHFQLGSLYIDLAKPDEAEKHLLLAAKLEPTSELYQRELGYFYFTARNDPLKSEPFDRRAVELGTKAPNVFYRLAKVCADTGRLEESEQNWRKLVALVPNNITANRQLAWVLSERGTALDEALTFANRAIELAAKNAAQLVNGYCTLAGVHRKRQEPAEAEEALKKAMEKALEIDPKTVDSPYLLGTVYEAMARKEEAVESYKKVLVIDPNHRGALEALKRLAG